LLPQHPHNAFPVGKPASKASGRNARPNDEQAVTAETYSTFDLVIILNQRRLKRLMTCEQQF
jgi:hypothetical protein